MKNSIYLFFGICIMAYGCSKDDTHVAVFDYHAHIHSPDSTARILGDTLKIEIDFESHTGQTVHHINVRIYNKSTNAEVYNKPSDPHVDTPVEYTYEDFILLNAANGFTSNSTWVLQAKVWGENDGQEEVIEQVEFNIGN
jgi:hypothetical protein